MKHLIFVIAVCLLSISSHAANVVRLPIEGMIDLGLVPYVKRGLAHAEQARAAVVVFDINTFGGRLDAAVALRDAIVASKVPTLAFINSRAISAGALISLACDVMVMRPGSTIGAATPVQMGPSGDMSAADEKMISYFRAEMRATAERRKRPALFAEAMVDRDIQIPGVIEKGKLLTLTDADAIKHHFADATADSLPNLLKARGYSDYTIESVETNWAEGVVRFLSEPTVNSLIMSIGMVGLGLMVMAGAIVTGGSIAAAAFTVYFFNQYLVELAGFEEFLCFLAGLLLIAAEIFVIPGFGLAGALGGLLVAASLVFSLVGSGAPLEWQAIENATGHLGLSFLVAIAALLVLLRFLPRTPLGSRMILKKTLEKSKDMAFQERQPLPSLGDQGHALTDLRPSGFAEFAGMRIDATSEGQYIQQGTAVVVLRHLASSVVVAPVVVKTQEKSHA